MAQNIIDLNENNFEAEVKNEKNIPVLVDFWAAWCGPCAAVAPVLEKMSAELSGKLKVCKVNIDDNQRITSDFGIMSIPTMILFKDGQEQERIVGALNESEYMRRLEKYIG